MTDLRRRVARRTRLWAAFRCAEPVVVLESDDWGLRRRPDPDAVRRWGTPSGWAHEHAETADDLDGLAAVLAGHRDPDGTPAALTMNVIAANPDHEAITADDFCRYHDRPVDETAPAAVVDRLRAGVADGVFDLQLHGRSHADVDRWLADLRAGHPGARELFAAGVDGGLALTSEQGWRYHSELLSWSEDRARTADDLEAWLAPAVATVTRLGGRAPRAAVAPHYVLTAEAEEAWRRLGVAYVQSAERRLRPQRTGRSYLGQPSRSGLVHLARTVRFDPRPGRQGHHLAETVEAVRRTVSQGLPAVIDTHRINFTGPWAADALGELDALLAVTDELGSRYLTATELGDAVTTDGTYRSARTGREHHLHVRGRPARAATRPLFGRARS